MPSGYMGKILVADLSTGELRDEILDEETGRKYIGGYGLGARFIYDRQKAGVDPIGPDSIFGITTGIFSGTPMISASRYIVVGKSPLTGFVGSGNKPVPLKEDEVNQILKQMDTDTPKVKVGFKQGQSVRVTDGPFTDFVGIVDEISAEKGKVKVLLSLFGRETPVELDFLQVEKL